MTPHEAIEDRALALYTKVRYLVAPCLGEAAPSAAPLLVSEEGHVRASYLRWNK